MKVGKIKSDSFYIGDICYVVGEDNYYNIWGNKYGFKDGAIDMGVNTLLVHGTAFGDGCFEDNKGNTYGVDAGVLGIVPKELIDWDKVSEYPKGISSVGTYITNAKEAEMFYDNGTFTMRIYYEDHQEDYIIMTDNGDTQYYEDQLQEIYNATMTFAQECSAIGYTTQAKQLDEVLSQLDHIKFE